MSPTVVLKEDSSPFMVLGTPGAARIITTVTQLISNVIDHGMMIQEGIDAPRIFNTATSTVAYEGRIDKSVNSSFSGVKSSLMGILIDRK